MSAETLRRAAELMRERAEKARADTFSRQAWKATVFDDGRAWIQPAHIAMHGYGATATHIAGMDPAVALAVANWLEYEALRLDSVARYSLFNAFQANTSAALAVARAYLGESA